MIFKKRIYIFFYITIIYVFIRFYTYRCIINSHLTRTQLFSLVTTEILKSFDNQFLLCNNNTYYMRVQKYLLNCDDDSYDGENDIVRTSHASPKMPNNGLRLYKREKF